MPSIRRFPQEDQTNGWTRTIAPRIPRPPLKGEVAADPRRRPRYDAYIAGAHQLLQEQQPGTAAEVPGLPAEIDAASTAGYTRRVLAGQAPVPEALAQQVQHIVRLCRQVSAQAQP